MNCVIVYRKKNVPKLGNRRCKLKPQNICGLNHYKIVNIKLESLPHSAWYGVWDAFINLSISRKKLIIVRLSHNQNTQIYAKIRNNP